MKRPYNLFHRANLGMRLSNVERSFGNKTTWETSLLDHCLKIIRELEAFPFPRTARKARIFDVNTLDLTLLPPKYDLIYIDPPYLNGRNVPVNYANFYHFLEGLFDYKLFSGGNWRYPHRPIVEYPSAWNSANGARDELDRLTRYWAKSVLFVSYRSDGAPTPSETIEILTGRGRKVEAFTCGGYKYVLSHHQSTEELFLISYP